MIWLLACSPDTDGDGFTDAVEQEAGTNPEYVYSRPYEEGEYEVGFCKDGIAEGESLTGEIYQVGEIAQNFTLNDQYDQPVDLYSFCGKQIEFELLLRLSGTKI